MNNLINMIWVETQKALRSRVPLFTTLGSLFMPLGMGFMLFISKNPEISRKLGLISAKAELLSANATNWPSYLGLFSQIIAAGGFFLFVLDISWVFGREFSDGTVKDMLAVPVRRVNIVLAKFFVAAVWSVAQGVVIYAMGLVMGALIGLQGGSASVMFHGSVLVAVTSVLVIVSVAPFAFFASVGRGYLLPIGAAVISLIMANLAMVAGWGEVFPWAVAGLYSQGYAGLTPMSYWIVFFTGLAGIVATYFWWQLADQTR
jgi:ABC-2 type transport system permease protein